MQMPHLKPLLFLLLLLGGTLPIQAQDDDEIKIPEPEKITLETKDGVLLRATYYPGTEGKETVPVILLHGFEGNRGEFDAFASALQKVRGHAVIVPDLRGHGDSTLQKIPGRDDITLKASDLKPADFGRMVTYDLEEVKKFLMNKNNTGELNIEQLCVVGSEMGGLLALNWTARDWSWPDLAGYKQGKDVKAVVLLSPTYSFKGASVSAPLSHPYFKSLLATRPSILIAAGKKDSKAFSDAKRMHGMIEKNYPKDAGVDQALFLLDPDVKLSGTKLLDPTLDVYKKVIGFIDLRLVNKIDDFKWTLRKNPLSN